MAHLLVNLSHQVVKACFAVCPFGIFGRPFQIGQCLGKSFLTYEQVRLRCVGLAQHPSRHRVAAHALQCILGIVVPVHLRVASRQPLPGFGRHGRFCGIESGDVGKRGRSFQKFAFFKLCLPHEQPRIFQKGVELLAFQVFLRLGIAAFSRTHYRASLDRMHRNGLLAFGNGRFELAFTRGARLFAAYQKNRKQFGVVVGMSAEFGLFAFDKCLFTIEVRVVVGCE